MTVVVNLRNEEEEKALYAFLNNLHYDYQTTVDDIILPEEQQSEIIRRDNDFVNGKTSARNWEDIKRDFKKVYR